MSFWRIYSDSMGPQGLKPTGILFPWSLQARTGLYVDPQLVCDYEALRQTFSSLCLWHLQADTQVCVSLEASKQMLSSCLTIGLVWRLSVRVYLEGSRLRLLLCVSMRWMLSSCLSRGLKADAQLVWDHGHLERLSALIYILSYGSLDSFYLFSFY